MAGGAILMGVLILFFAVADALVIHGIAQMSSNGWRVVLHFKHIYWAVIGYFLFGVFSALAFFTFFNLVFEKWLVFIFLGGVCLLVVLLPQGKGLDFARPRSALLCGLSTMGLHLTAGVAGPILDMFFVDGKMNRYQILATKSFTQSIGHLLKILYFTQLVDSKAHLDFAFWIYGLIILLAFMGAFFGRVILGHFTDQNFKQAMKILLAVLGCFYFGEWLAFGFYAISG